MEYQDFELLVTADNTIRAASLQGEEQGVLSVDTAAIELAIQLVEHASTNADLLKSLGGHLFRALFSGDIHAHLRASLAGAAATGAGLRIRLILEPPEIASLPWEFLYDADSGYYLANSPQTALSRYISVPVARGALDPAGLPLRILLVISAPQDMPTLDTEGEIDLIQDALKNHLANGQVALDVLREGTIRAINHKLRSTDYHIFHFVGHAAFQEGRGHVALVNPSNEAHFVDDEAFSNFFLGYPGLGLVILNACQGATLSSHTTFAGIAPLLVRRGIPAVIAMQYPIPDDTAKLFADEFYRTLALGWPVDAAIQTTRNAISMERGLNVPDFATPVLFMRARDGVILDIG